MSHSTLAVIGLGANLGDPIHQLLSARNALNDLSVDGSTQCSHFYLSSPVGYSDQPYFVNAVATFKTALLPDDLLNHTQQIETNLGRKRDPKNQNAARTIDLDILLYGDHIINDERLVVPHPRMNQRLFVLAPLVELLSLEALLPFEERKPLKDIVPYVDVKSLISDLTARSELSEQKVFKLSL